ncbi:TPA: hypothetical protein EYO57_20405, partial [Candidatus Poribacteria bacterium]|nr:hypothetical protein [Candidatus Poribacteria bacterium]
METEFEQFKAFVQGKGVVYTSTGRQDVWSSRPGTQPGLAAVAQPEVRRIVRPVKAFLTQTEAGPLDVSQRADGTLAIMAPPTGLSVTHPTLSDPYTGRKPTRVSGMVDAGPAFTVMVDPASAVFPPADVLQTINILEAGSAEQMAKDARKTMGELEEQLQLPPVMNYENIIGSLPADTQDTINQMVTTMVDRLTGEEAPSRITGPTEHISGAEHRGPVIPGGDVCQMLLDELKALKQDLTSTTIKAKIVRYMRAIGRATTSTSAGQALLGQANEFMDQLPTPATITEIYNKALSACAILSRVAAKTGQTMAGVSRQLWGGPDVSDRSQDIRRHKDFGKAMQAKDREDLSSEPSKVSNPRDKNYKPVPESLDLHYMTGYTAPVFYATTGQFSEPGRAKAEEQYKRTIKDMEKYTLNSLNDPTHKKSLMALYDKGQALKNKYGFPELTPIVHDQKSLRERIRVEKQIVLNLTGLEKETTRKANEFRKLAIAAGTQVKHATQDIKNTKRKINAGSTLLSRANTAVRKAQMAQAKNSTTKTTKALNKATRAQTHAANTQQGLVTELGRQENSRTDAVAQKSAATTGADLAKASKKSLRERNKNVKLDLKLLGGTKVNLKSAEDRRRNVMNQFQKGFTDKEASKRLTNGRSYGNLGVELAATKA